jgi:hypothetical protein
MSLKETKHGFARVLTNKYFNLMKTALNLSLVAIALSIFLTTTPLAMFGYIFGSIFTLTALVSGRELIETSKTK